MASILRRMIEPWHKTCVVNGTRSSELVQVSTAEIVNNGISDTAYGRLLLSVMHEIKPKINNSQ